MTSSGNPIGGIVVKGGQNPRPQDQSIVNTSKSNVKDRVATELTADSGGGDPPPPQPEEGAINTTRSNIKNTS